MLRRDTILWKIFKSHVLLLTKGLRTVYLESASLSLPQDASSILGV